MLASFEIEIPSLIILDIMLPDSNGLQLAETIRQTSTVPILILSVRDETTSKLTALDLGADDYITKPFRVDELLARVRAILRRVSTIETNHIYSYNSGGLQVDLNSLQVTSHDRQIQLTPREWSTLRVLVNHAGRVVSTRQLHHEAWGTNIGEEGDNVRTYITRLRQKLEPEPHNPRYILLVRGLGYRLVRPEL